MKTEFKIGEFTNPSGEKVFRVSGWFNQRRVRENYPTREEALTAKQNWERQVLNLEPLPAVTTRLTNDQVTDAEFCLRLLEGKKLTMRAAIEFAIKNFAHVEKKCTVKDGLEKFIADKNSSRAGGVSAVTQTKYRERLKKLVDAHGDKFLNEIMPEHLEPLIFRSGSGDMNRFTDRKELVNFFNWAVFREFCVKNPCAKIRKIKVDFGEPVILALGEVRAIIHHAKTYRDGICLPFAVLALFAGMRIKEIRRFAEFGGWENFQLGTDRKGATAGQLILGPKICKGRSRRIIQLDRVALEFIQPMVLAKTAIIVPNFRHHWEQVRKLAGLGEWKQDVLRHTAISYKLAAINAASSESMSGTWSESQTSEWAGNSPAVIHKHYRGLIRTAEDVDKFWGIRPGDTLELTELAA